MIRSRRLRHPLLLLLALAGLGAAEVELAITDRQLHAIDRRLFGQFLERPFAGEHGPEAYADAHGDLPGPIVQALADMRIPTVRFPGGTAVDYSDWTYLIDRAPGRTEPLRTTAHARDPAQVVTTRFGWHEYFRLADRLGWETIAVTNLLDGLARRVPLADAARHAAGLVAYLNAPLGATLPEGMPDWPAIRAANGHPQPFHARYIQLGNEWFMGDFKAAVKAAVGDLPPEQLAAWYVEVLRAYVAAIRSVDPGIEIIIDANGRAGASVLPDPVLRREVRYVAIHTYAPWSTDRLLTRRKVTVATDELKPDAITADELWQSWSAMPGVCGPDGQNLGFGADRLALPRSLGYRVAVTEWNWVGFGFERMPTQMGLYARRAAGVGTAQFLHGMLRQGDLIDIGIQSIVLGTEWDFAALRAAADGRLIRSPQGQVTTFYNLHHGPFLLDSRLSGAETAPGTLSIGWAFAQPAIAQVDALATGDGSRVVAHLVNRGRDPLPITLRVSTTAHAARLHRLLPCAAEADDALGWFSEDELEAPVVDGVCRFELPAMAVVAAEMGR